MKDLKERLAKHNKRIQKLLNDVTRVKEYKGLESSMICSNCQEIAMDEQRLDEYSRARSRL
jgi:hypothetical protein